MKRVILDEGVPRQVIRALPDHEAMTVPASGWASIKNGKLLALIEQAGFDALITCDKNMEFQQRQLESRPFAVLLLSTNHWPSIKPYVARVAEALEHAQPGSIQKIDCGRFIPRRRRKLGSAVD